MSATNDTTTPGRYSLVTEEKSSGIKYTPSVLADFVAGKIVEILDHFPVGRPLRVLDPAVGDGELLISLLARLANTEGRSGLEIEVHGFETDESALQAATGRIKHYFPAVRVCFEARSFVEFVLEDFGESTNRSLFSPPVPERYDIIIANPPYVRTQVMGAAQAQLLARQFGLSGRVDLYYSFILGMAQVLAGSGVAGIIVSNRFMTTKSGSPVRKAILERFNVQHIWDLGDTKLFDAAVLPAVLLMRGKNGYDEKQSAFTSIYETSELAHSDAADPIAALAAEGVIRTYDGRNFRVQHGTLDTSGTPDGVWRVGTDNVEAWLAIVEGNTWGTFRDIGNIRTGVKTCADKVFIQSGWHETPAFARPELLRPLTTHHVAGHFKARPPKQHRWILYPHEVVEGRRRAVDLTKFPLSCAYLEQHRSTLENRTYVIEAGREWYEIWVPQDPDAWHLPKLVFRDIAEEPTFWIDLDGSVVNGDCYWLTCNDPEKTDLLWLAAAVGNSTLIERFYDYRFHNKLYAGRRRFITQYVEKFPLPDPYSSTGQAIIAMAKRIYECTPSSEADLLRRDIDTLVWEAFGLIQEEPGR